MRHRILIAAAYAACLLNGTAFAAEKLLQNMPLKWSPTQTMAEMGTIDVSGALLTTRVRVDAFADNRDNKETIAENREKADKIRPVTTSDNVAAFVTDHLRESLHKAGMNTVDGAGDISISGEVRRFFVTETNLYRGDVSLLVHVKNGAGKEIWSGVIEGGAEHFGRSYKAENYSETVSDMILRAAYNLLANKGFHDAVLGH